MIVDVTPEDVMLSDHERQNNPITHALLRQTQARWDVVNGKVVQDIGSYFRYAPLPPPAVMYFDALKTDFNGNIQPQRFQIPLEEAHWTPSRRRQERRTPRSAAGFTLSGMDERAYSDRREKNHLYSEGNGIKKRLH